MMRLRELCAMITCRSRYYRQTHVIASRAKDYLSPAQINSVRKKLFTLCEYAVICCCWGMPAGYRLGCECSRAPPWRRLRIVTSEPYAIASGSVELYRSFPCAALLQPEPLPTFKSKTKTECAHNHLERTRSVVWKAELMK